MVTVKVITKMLMMMVTESMTVLMRSQQMQQSGLTQTAMELVIIQMLMMMATA